MRSAHLGPLRVQRPFYPEGDHEACHVYVLHPPGGVVSGDQLTTELALGEHTRALLTAPGASKLYRARQAADATPMSADIQQHFRVGEQATLEWLPHETIAFDGARAAVVTRVELAASATYAGWELWCLGRPACGERFTHGELKSELSVRREGKLCYLERGLFRGGDPLLDARWGLAGMPVWGSFLVASPHVSETWVSALRDALDEAPYWAATLVSRVLLVRYLGNSTREARRLFESAFHVLRPLYAGRPAVHPRIWST